MGSWIRLDQKLPKEEQTVIVLYYFYKDGHTMRGTARARYSKGDFDVFGEVPYGYRVKAWRRR